MATEDLVTEQFQLLGIDVEKAILTKCVSLCKEHNVDAETFIERWMAFSLNQLNGASPTLENLDLLARKEFSKRLVERTNAPTTEASRSSTGTSLTVYGTPVTAQSDNDLLCNYMTTTPKTKRHNMEIKGVYDVLRVKVESVPVPANQSELRPATYSPTTGRSAKYASRLNPGSIVHSYGDEKLLEIISKPNTYSTDILNLHITQIPNEDGELYTKPLFGFELLHEKVSIFDNHIRYVSQCIMQKAGITETSSVRHKTQTEVCVAGRIECDADARLNPKCVILQGTWEESLSQTVPVDIDNLKDYSLFPGQVVVMRGINPRGDKFIAHEVYCDASRSVPNHNADILNALEGKLSMVIAAGPFTTSDNMAYEPFRDLITSISTHKPHVVLLTGPFMDTEHAKVKDNSMAETYKSFFEKLMDSLAELQTTSPLTKIYIVSNVKDAFHVNIYPTPAYSTRRRHANITFLPDPCTLNINGVVVGITGTDVLMHISQEEISLGGAGDKLSRLARYVISQQGYHPVWVAAPALPVDAALWAAHAQLPHTPHILVLPSNFRYFIKEVNGSVVVNPEHLTKGLTGGTFARLLVAGGTDLSIGAQILRI